MGNGGVSNDRGGRNTRKTFAPWSDAAARALVRFDGVSKRFAGTAAVDQSIHKSLRLTDVEPRVACR